MAELLNFILFAIQYLLGLYVYVILAAVIFSWLIAFNVINFNNEFVRTIYRALEAMTEPALRPIRRILPDLGGIDLSPIVLLIAIFFVQEFIGQVVAPNVNRMFG